MTEQEQEEQMVRVYKRGPLGTAEGKFMREANSLANVGWRVISQSQTGAMGKPFTITAAYARTKPKPKRDEETRPMAAVGRFAAQRVGNYTFEFDVATQELRLCWPGEQAFLNPEETRALRDFLVDVLREEDE